MYGIDQIELAKASPLELRRKKAVLKLLLHKGLVKIDVSQGEPIYRITSKGSELLRKYAEFELYNRRFGALRVNV
ncbi:MAG: winged helix-turn-helix domain-containing protein [Candidatus Methanosuratincola sp.]